MKIVQEARGYSAIIGQSGKQGFFKRKRECVAAGRGIIMVRSLSGPVENDFT